MQCPVCKDATLVMTEKQGIEIDYCPQCRGVWLDRGELDKIIDRTLDLTVPPAPPPPPAQPARQYDPGPPRGRRDYDDDDDYDRYPRHRKRKSLLSELFDFD